MRVLILEDDPNRVEKFLNGLRSCEAVEVTDKADKCIEFLAKYEWDLLFLDHDCPTGQKHIPDGKEPFRGRDVYQGIVDAIQWISYNLRFATLHPLPGRIHFLYGPLAILMSVPLNILREPLKEADTL